MDTIQLHLAGNGGTGGWGEPLVSSQPLKQPPRPAAPQVEWKQVLVLGLDGAGKSSVLHYICSQTARKRIPPTLGFNSAQLQVEGLEMDLLEGKAVRFPWEEATGTQGTQPPYSPICTGTDPTRFSQSVAARTCERTGPIT